MPLRGGSSVWTNPVELMMETGIYEMCRKDYDEVAAINASLLLAGPTMAHRKAYADGLRHTSEAMTFGTGLHCFMLEPDEFPKRYTVIPKRRRAGKEWDGACAEALAAGKQIVFAEDVETFVAMRAALHKSARRRALATTPGRYETVVIWIDKLTGLLCKGMLDKLIEKIDTIVDLKRAVRADAWGFGKAAGDHGYDVRGAWYIDAMHAITGRWHDYVLLPQEPEPPYCSAMYRMERGDEAYRAGRWKYRTTIAGWAQCLKSGEYPDYGNDVQALMLPKHHLPQNMMEDSDDSVGNNSGPAGEEIGSVESCAADRGDEAVGVFGVSA